MNESAGPARHPAVETAVFGREAVLYDDRSGTVHHLNPSAYAVWELLDGRPVADVIAALAGTTGLSTARLEGDVLRVVAEFRDAGLVSG